MELVEQLLQALVEAGPDTGGLAGPPPRHDPPPPFAALEREIADAFPALANVGYPAVLQALYAHVLPVLASELVQLVASDQDAPLDELQEEVFRYNPELIAGQGLLAIASEGHAQGLLCLDTRVGGPPEAWPVVLWRHGWEDVTATLYSSAERMLACVTHRLRGGTIAELAAIDPQGSAASYYAYLDRPRPRVPAPDHGVLGPGVALGGGPTQVVDQPLQALVEDGIYGLTWPQPRHDPPPAFAELEREIAGAFPALAHVRYPAALQALYAHPLPFLDCRLVRLVASPSGAPLRELRELVFNSWWPELIAGQGLLAVADEGNDGGPLCLDTRAGDSPETWPVVFWDHDWQQVTATPFSSTDRMLACVIHLLQGGKIADLAGIDPQGSATEYAFLDK